MQFVKVIVMAVFVVALITTGGVIYCLGSR